MVVGLPGISIEKVTFFSAFQFFLHFTSRISRRPFRSICKIWVFVNPLEVKTSNIESLFFWKSPTWFAKFGGTSHAWMSQEVSKRLGSVGYSPNILHLQVGEITHESILRGTSSVLIYCGECADLFLARLAKRRFEKGFCCPQRGATPSEVWEPLFFLRKW